MNIEPLRIADPLSLPALDLELQQRYLVWDLYAMGKRRVDLHPFILTEKEHRSAVEVAEKAWRLVHDAGKRALGNAEEAAKYRFHPDTARLAAAAEAGGDDGSVARVDLLLQYDGRWVACEVNADCPGGYNEAVGLPKMARALGATDRDPTHAAATLADALIAKANGGLIALVYATGYAEDLQVCAIVERMVRERGGRTVRCSPTNLKAHPEGVAYRGERVSVLYRFYPLEYMCGQKNLDALIAATQKGQLACFSAFNCIYSQSKLAMARAYAHDAAATLTAFPETYAFQDMSRAQLIAERGEWVVKRDLSRVGDHVYVGALTPADEFAQILDEVAAVSHEQAWIVQRFIPQKPIRTPWGNRLITLGAYVINGAFAGYFARFSPTSHCSHDALVLPVFVREAA